MVNASFQQLKQQQIAHQWRSALAEYGHLAAADRNDLTAHAGVAWALANGGHIEESCLVLGTALYRSTLSEAAWRPTIESGWR